MPETRTREQWAQEYRTRARFSSCAAVSDEYDSVASLLEAGTRDAGLIVEVEHQWFDSDFCRAAIDGTPLASALDQLTDLISASQPTEIGETESGGENSPLRVADSRPDVELQHHVAPNSGPSNAVLSGTAEQDAGRTVSAAASPARIICPDCCGSNWLMTCQTCYGRGFVPAPVAPAQDALDELRRFSESTESAMQTVTTAGALPAQDAMKALLAEWITYEEKSDDPYQFNGDLVRRSKAVLEGHVKSTLDALEAAMLQGRHIVHIAVDHRPTTHFVVSTERFGERMVTFEDPTLSAAILAALEQAK